MLSIEMKTDIKMNQGRDLGLRKIGRLEKKLQFLYSNFNIIYLDWKCILHHCILYKNKYLRIADQKWFGITTVIFNVYS